MSAMPSPAAASCSRGRPRGALGFIARARASLPAAEQDTVGTALAAAHAHLLAHRPGAAVALLAPLLAPPAASAGLSAAGRLALAEALAGAYRRDARYQAAIAVATALPAPSPQAWFECGMAHLALGQAEAALAAFDATLAIDPGRAAAWFASHGPALDLAGPAEAARRLDRALACDGANGRYWAYPYAYARLAGDHSHAEALWRQHLAAFPRRRPLAEGIDALHPRLAPTGVRVFGVAAALLRHALAEARTPGLVLEFGVRRGTSLTVLAEAAGQAVHGFDSFVGLPEAWDGKAAGTLSAGAELPAVPANAHLHPGWFADTLPPFLAAHPGPARLVNIDSDLYASAALVLEELAPRLGPGAVLVFDEFIGNRTWAEDEYRAFQEYAAVHRADWQVIALAPATKQVAIRLR